MKACLAFGWRVNRVDPGEKIKIVFIKAKD